MKLLDIADVTSSKRVYANQYKKEGISFYRGKEINQLSNGEKISSELFITYDLYGEIKEKYGVPQKDVILLTAVGTIGNLIIVNDEKFYFKDGNVIWIKKINKLKVNPRY